MKYGYWSKKILIFYCKQTNIPERHLTAISVPQRKLYFMILSDKPVLCDPKKGQKKAHPQ